MSVWPMSTGVWPVGLPRKAGPRVIVPPVDPMTIPSLFAWLRPDRDNFQDAAGTVAATNGGIVRTVRSTDNHAAWTGNSAQLHADATTREYFDMDLGQDVTKWTDPILTTDGAIKCWQFGDLNANVFDELSQNYKNDTTLRRLIIDFTTNLIFPLTIVCTFKVQQYINWNTILDSSETNAVGLHTDQTNAYMYNTNSARLSPKAGWNIIVLHWGSPGPVDANSSYILNGKSEVAASPGTTRIYLPGLVLGNKPVSDGDAVFYGWLADLLVFRDKISYTNAIGVSSYVNNSYGNVIY